MKVRTKIIIVSVLLIIGIVFAACSAKNDEASYDMAPRSESKTEMSYEAEEGGYYDDDVAQASGSAADALAGGYDQDIQDKIIYYVDMTLVSDDPQETSEQLVDKANLLGGYVSYSNMRKSSSNNAVYVSLQVRIPSAQLDEMKAYAEDIADVEHSSMSSDNITESYYDIKQRLAHEELQAEQLEAIMEQAETVEDILAVREHLAQVQQNIEVYKGKLRFWDSQVDYSTITFSINPTPTLDNAPDGPRLITLGETGRAIVRVFKNSAIFVANALSWLLQVIVALIIPAIIIVPVVLLIIFLVKRRRRKKGMTKDVTPSNSDDVPLE